MQQGGSPYGTLPTDMTLFSSSLQPSSAAVQQQQRMTAATATESVNVRPPLPSQQHSAGHNYEELGSAEDPLGEEIAGGGGGMSGGNRWPRQETLALLKIRSELDAAFRDATLKGPLWEEVSRKLGELGYSRSAKKCKEKFENVHKYYKRTKEGRAGRQDGKSYRFFSQLEALHNTPGASSSTLPSVFSPSPSPTSMMTGTSGRFQTPQVQQQQQQQHQNQISAPMPLATAPPQPMVQMFGQEQSVGAAVAAAGISFSSNTSSDAAASEDEDEEEEDGDDEATEEGPSSGAVGKKRKREGEGGGSRKMMAFFEGLMRQVMERQEAMQQRFLDAIEAREKDRMIREEAWRRQELARLGREQEIEAAERAASAARDAAVISFLQKLTGQSVPVPVPVPVPASVPVSVPAPVSLPVPNPPQPQQQQAPPTPTPPPKTQEQHYHQPPALMLPTSTELVPLPSEPYEGGSMSLDPTSSRWPKSEVNALIKLRSGLDTRYQESGPKGPLWEEISSGMQRLGYNRSSKRCKEKWENINKYFKKVKESNKKRPEDAKTCPYFHQLDALYRSKQQIGITGSGVPALTQRAHESETQPNPISIMPPPPPQQDSGSNNGGKFSTFFGDNGDNSTDSMMKKPEDIVKELMVDPNANEFGRAVDEPDSDNMDEDLDEDDEDDDDGTKAQYRIQFQRQNVSGNNGSGGATGASGGGKAAAGSFLAMVR